MGTDWQLADCLSCFVSKTEPTSSETITRQPDVRQGFNGLSGTTEPRNEAMLVEHINGTGREIIDENLSEGEPVYVCIEGTTGQFLVATDRRIIIIRTSFGAGGMWLSKQCQTFLYENVTSIYCSNGSAMGRLQVNTEGSMEMEGGYYSGAFRAQNVVSFGPSQYGKFETAANMINGLVEAHKNRFTERSAAESIPDQIRKLAELKDTGILTVEEFACKKSELLERI
jgi:hypothetical protein